MNIKGFIELELRNIETNELEYEYSQNNTVGFLPYYFLTLQYNAILNSGTTNGTVIGINISDTKCELTKFTNNISATQTDSTFNITGTAVPNEYWPQYTNDTANSRHVIQFKQRFNPGTATRTIKTISLTNNNAGLLLTTPCVQTTTQILDIYYSLYFSYDTSKYNDTHFNQAYLNSNGILGQLFANYTTQPVYVPGTNTLLNNYFNVIDNSANTGITSGMIAVVPHNNLEINGKQSTYRLGAYGGWGKVTPTRNLCQGTSTFMQSLQNTDWIGTMIANVGYYPSNCTWDQTVPTSTTINQPLLMNPILKPTDSPIQSVYLKTPNYSTISPYLDPSAIGGSTGTIAFDGSGWTDGDIPLMFKFNISNSGTGALATTSYNFQVRPTFGFGNNNIGSENTWWLFPGVGAQNQTNEIAPNVVHYNYPLLTSSLWLTFIRVENDNKHVVTCDLNGISILNVYTSNFINFDSTTTPSMPTTAINDFASGPDGAIYVATTDQGLYKISADRTTVTQYSSIGTGITDTICYSVAIKNNGDIWAAFSGGLAMLPNGSSTWTIYNSTTTPSFTYAGISDNNWAHINKIFVNKTNTTDQLLIVRKDMNQCIWWGPTTPTPVVLNNMMNGFANPAVIMDRYIKHLPNTNSWFINTNTVATLGISYPIAINICSFGNTGSDKLFYPGKMTSGTNGMPYSAVCMAPMLYNGSYIMRLMVGYQYNGSSTYGWNGYYDGTGTLVYDPFNGGNGPSLLGFGTGTSAVATWVGDNICLYQYNVVSSGSMMRLYNAYDVIGAANANAWKTYGWDSVNNVWTLNGTGYKPMHTSSDPFYQGLNVSFADADSNSNFNNGEYWFAYVYKGLHKDNSTSATFGLSMNVRDSYMNSELSDYTVPSSGLGAITNQPLNYNTLNASYAPIMQYKGQAGVGAAGSSYNTLAVAPYSEQLFPGDFQINFSATSVAANTGTTYYALLGVFDTTLVNPTWSTSGVGYFNFNYTGFVVGEAGSNKTTPQAFSASDIFSIKRTGTQLQYLYNGTVIYTSTTTYANPMRSMIIFYGEGSRTFNNINCSYTEPRTLVTIGSQENSTGIYDQNFAMVEAWVTSPPTYQINLNGTPCTNIWTDPVKVPAPGECLLLQKSGWIVFNPADAGKAITSNVMILKEF